MLIYFFFIKLSEYGLVIGARCDDSNITSLKPIPGILGLYFLSTLTHGLKNTKDNTENMDLDTQTNQSSSEWQFIGKKHPADDSRGEQ